LILLKGLDCPLASKVDNKKTAVIVNFI